MTARVTTTWEVGWEEHCIGDKQRNTKQTGAGLLTHYHSFLTISNPVTHTQAPTFYSLNADIAAAAAAATEDREGRELDSAAEITDIKNIGGKNRGQNRG